MRADVKMFQTYCPLITLFFGLLLHAANHPRSGARWHDASGA